jgi:formylglycine-generating enzyme required for sulfatase activity
MRARLSPLSKFSINIIGYCFALLVFYGGYGIAVAQSSLPPEVQADLLGRQISDALKREDVNATLAAFDQYHKLDVTIPPPWLFVEAKVAWAANDATRAFGMLQNFLRVTEREGTQYNEALALYSSYETAAKAMVEAALPALLSGLEFIDIPAGNFRMGDSDEKPIHAVQIQGFRLMAHEVAFREWTPCVTAGVCPEVDGSSEDVPVVAVSWDDIQLYVGWLNGMTSGGYRLPTEAEWEYAARAGSTTDYSWGNKIDCSQASYSGCDGIKPIKSFAANAFGLYDMHGNVWEWVEDCWHGDYSGAPENGEAWVTGGDCSGRVLRGGSWFGDPDGLRSAYRNGYAPATRDFDYGFRLAQDL